MINADINNSDLSEPDEAVSAVDDQDGSTQDCDCTDAAETAEASPEYTGQDESEPEANTMMDGDDTGNESPEESGSDDDASDDDTSDDAASDDDDSDDGDSEE